MIKKNNDDTYTVTYSTRNKFGQKIKRSRSGITNYAVAKNTEAELIIELHEIKNGFEYAGFTFSRFCDEIFFPHYEKNYSDADSFVKRVNKWSGPISKLKLEVITPNDIAGILEAAKDDLVYSSLVKLRSCFSRIFEHARSGGLQVNPCDGVKIPVPRSDSNCKVLTRDEANHLLKMSRRLQPTWYKIWAVHLLTGIRSGEGYALCKSDIDLESDNIMINKAWTSKTGIKSTKTGHWRIVPICKTLKPLLIELMVDRKTGNELLPKPHQWTRGSQARILKEFCTGIGITPIRFHDLRATFITQLFQNGASIAEVQAVVGHTELKTTQRYLRLAGVDVKGVTNKLSFTIPSEIDNVVSLHDRVELFGT
jgi:integrase